MRTRLVVAGNNWQFRDFVSARPEEERPRFVEVKTLYHLRGWEDVEVHLVGSWRQRKDADKIEEELKERHKNGVIAELNYWTD